MHSKTIRTLFIIRILLWITALGATIYWIYWSFKLYSLGIHDVYEYAAHFRPIFNKALLVSILAIVISLILRSISDKLKKLDK